MIRITTRGEYGTRLMVELAKNYGRNHVLLRKISTAQDISIKYLGQLVIPLKVAGLVKSARGAHGGYSLSKSPERISLLEIMEATEGSLYLYECVEDPDVCSRSHNCIARSIWRKASKAFIDVFRSITLKDMIEGNVE